MLDWFFNIDWRDYIVPLTILLIFSIAIGDYLKDILSWIKLQWKNAIPLKRVYIVVASIIGSALFILFISLYYQLINIILGNVKTTISTIDANFALAFLGTVTGGVALFSGFLAILRSEEDKNQNKIAKSQSRTAIQQSQIALRQSKIAQQQADTAEQGLITDRINKAVESLGKLNQENKPVLEVRIGALYALERIAQDSIDDHVRIMKIICAYVCVNSPFINKATKTKIVSDDIRVALNIIGHRDKWTEDERHLNKEKKENYRLDLRHCNLNNIELYSADLSGALFSGGTLRDAILVRVNFNDASFFETDISDADFQDSDMTNINAQETYAHTGNFLNCLTFTPEQINKMFLGMDVKLADGLDHPQEGTVYDKTYDEFKKFIAAYRTWQKTPK